MFRDIKIPLGNDMEYEVQARRRRWRLSRKHFSKFFHMTFHENINNVRGWRLAFNVHAPQNSDYHNVKR